MKVLLNYWEDGCRTLVVEEDYHLFKRVKTYKLFDSGALLRYHGDDTYSDLGLMEISRVRELLQTPDKLPNENGRTI